MMDNARPRTEPDVKMFLERIEIETMIQVKPSCIKMDAVSWHAVCCYVSSTMPIIDTHKPSVPSLFGLPVLIVGPVIMCDGLHLFAVVE